MRECKIKTFDRKMFNYYRDEATPMLLQIEWSSKRVKMLFG